MKRHEPTPIGIGVISILTVLLVLVLSVFAALALASARADLALSRKNAETVTAQEDQQIKAKRAADAQAAQLYANFAAGTEESLEETIPMTEHQALVLRLERTAEGAVRVLEWRTVAIEPELDEHLPVWDGTTPQN